MTHRFLHTEDDLVNVFFCARAEETIERRIDREGVSERQRERQRKKS